MRVLLSTIGSRGDVQPLVALALRLRALGHGVRIAVPPDFREWIEGLGVAVIPMGPSVRSFAASRPAATGSQGPVTADTRRAMAAATVATQFDTLGPAARDCDIIVAATALQIAARSIAEAGQIPYVFVAYSPTVLPSPHHPPPALPPLPGDAQPATTDNQELWARDTARFNDLFGAALNDRRASLGLPPVSDVRRHMFGTRPWLAADPTIGPWPEPADEGVFQTGAWILPDDRPLSRELEAFLENGEPPIYFGFGSTQAPQETGRAMREAARALGRRAIVSKGWFDAPLVDDDADCLSIGDANVLALFPRVAAVVHHGGAGTTTAAALAGAPQVVVPHRYDQHYWARQVPRLGIGCAHGPGTPTADTLARALEETLTPDTRARAKAVAAAVRRDGADRAVAAIEQMVSEA